MEFKEFNNPEERDYDITSSLNSNEKNTTYENNYYSEQLMNLIGILEDVTEEELQEQYGIGIDEYFNPNAQTIEKVTERLNNLETIKHR